MRKHRPFLALAVAMALLQAVPSRAQTGTEPAQTALQTAAPAAGPVIGASSDLPIPRFVSLKAGVANVRRGPDRNHRIDWIYERRGLPLRVVGEYDVWRRVEDFEGEGGWIHFALLSGIRTVLVTQDMAPLRRSPRADSLEVALLEAGVVARILECGPVWCRLSIDGTRGWTERSALWGLDEGEILE